MSETIGTLSLKVAANTRELSSGLGKGLGDIRGFADKGLGALKTMSSVMGGGFVAGAAFGKFGEVMQRRMDEFKELKKTSLSTGISIQRTSELMAGAGEAGDQLPISLRHMNKELGLASRGSAEAEDKFAALGLETGELLNLKPDEAFLRIADRISLMSSEYDRAAAATTIFGKAGQELLPMLSKGSKGIDETIAKAKELGITFSGGQAQIQEKTNAAQKQWGKFVKGAENTLATAGGGLALLPEMMGDFFSGNWDSDLMNPDKAEERDWQKKRDALSPRARKKAEEEDTFRWRGDRFKGKKGAERNDQGETRDEWEKRWRKDDQRLNLDPKSNAAFAKHKREMTERAESIGLTPEQQLERQMDKDGISEPRKKELRDLQDKAKKATLGEDIKKENEGLDDQIGKLAQGADAWAREKLAARGATKEQLDQMKLKQEMLLEMKVGNDVAENRENLGKSDEEREIWKARKEGANEATIALIEYNQKLKFADKTMRENKTESTSFLEQLDKLENARATMGEDVYGSAVTKLLMDADQSNGEIKGGASAVTEGSAAAISAITKHRLNAERDQENPADAIKRILEQMKSREEEKKRLQEGMKKALDEIAVRAILRPVKA